MCLNYQYMANYPTDTKCNSNSNSGSCLWMEVWLTYQLALAWFSNFSDKCTCPLNFTVSLQNVCLPPPLQAVTCFSQRWAGVPPSAALRCCDAYRRFASVVVAFSPTSNNNIFALMNGGIVEAKICLFVFFFFLKITLWAKLLKLRRVVSQHLPLFWRHFWNFLLLCKVATISIKPKPTTGSDVSVYLLKKKNIIVRQHKK